MKPKLNETNGGVQNTEDKYNSGVFHARRLTLFKTAFMGVVTGTVLFLILYLILFFLHVEPGVMNKPENEHYEMAKDQTKESDSKGVWRSVYHRNGLFVMVDRGKVMLSNDGNNWEELKSRSDFSGYLEPCTER